MNDPVPALDAPPTASVVTIDTVTAASQGVVELRMRGRAAEVVLTRPDKLNAIGRATLAGIDAALAHIAADETIRVAIIHGEGRGFCAGADLQEVGALVSDAAAFDAFLDEWHRTLAGVHRCRVPVIGAIHGVAFAGGFELLQVCDLVVIGDGTVLGDQHANFGLFPAGGSTQRLARLVGPRMATWLLMSGAQLQPADALACGLVNRVVAETEVLAEGRAMADLLAAKSAAGLAAIKAAQLLGDGLDVDAALRAERTLAVTHMTSNDVQIGLEAFRTRSVPDFG